MGENQQSERHLSSQTKVKTLTLIKCLWASDTKTLCSWWGALDEVPRHPRGKQATLLEKQMLIFLLFTFSVFNDHLIHGRAAHERTCTPDANFIIPSTNYQLGLEIRSAKCSSGWLAWFGLVKYFGQCLREDWEKCVGWVSHPTTWHTSNLRKVYLHTTAVKLMD